VEEREVFAEGVKALDVIVLPEKAAAEEPAAACAEERALECSAVLKDNH
jgi:hypothetical protein